MDITCPFALPPPRHVEARVRIYEEDVVRVVGYVKNFFEDIMTSLWRHKR